MEVLVRATLKTHPAHLAAKQLSYVPAADAAQRAISFMSRSIAEGFPRDQVVVMGAPLPTMRHRGRGADGGTGKDAD